MGLMVVICLQRRRYTIAIYKEGVLFETSPRAMHVDFAIAALDRGRALRGERSVHLACLAAGKACWSHYHLIVARSPRLQGRGRPWLLQEQYYIGP